MKKISTIIIILLLSIAILFADDISYLVKNKILLKGHISPKIYKQVDFDFMPNMQIKSFKKGIVTYDGRVARYIDENGDRLFSLNLESNNYQLQTSKEKIYILDRLKRTIYFIDRDGKSKSIVLDDSKSPLFIKSNKNKLFLNYKNRDNKEIEGFSIIDNSGKEIKDYTFAKENITIMKDDRVNGGYILSSFSLMNSQLENSIILYNSKGEIKLAERVKDRIFSDIIPFDGGYYLIEDEYIEKRDLEFKRVKATHLNYKIEDIYLKGDKLILYNDKNYLINLDQNLDEISRVKYLNQINQIMEVSDHDLVLTKNSINIGKEKLDFIDDAKEIIDIENGRLAIVFRGNIKFIDIY